MFIAHFDELDLDARSQVGWQRKKYSALNCLDTLKQVINITPATNGTSFFFSHDGNNLREKEALVRENVK